MENNEKAFSLIELMIVITIIGILAAVAVPSYRAYIIKAKVSAAIVLLKKPFDDAVEYMVINGSSPNPLVTGGHSIGHAVHVNYNIDNISHVGYWKDLASTSSAPWNVLVCGYLLGLQGATGYTEPVPNSSLGVRSRVCLAARIDGNGNIERVCGRWDGGANDIDSAYLPGSCSCTIHPNQC